MVLLILAAVQVPQPGRTAARGDRFQIMVPQGWKAVDEGALIFLEHETGATLTVRRAAPGRNSAATLERFAADSVERIMTPLGFAKLGAPRRSKQPDIESVQYEIRGNRLSARRRILYRAVRRETGTFEVIYENSEERFELLLAEAQSVGSSLQTLPEQVPQRGRGRR